MKRRSVEGLFQHPRVAVEKLLAVKITKNKIASGCPTNDFLNFLDILYPQILAIWEEPVLFQQPRLFSTVVVPTSLRA
jgi:hypothetical protein